MQVLHRQGARPLKWGRIVLHLGGGLLAAELMFREALPVSWQTFTYSFTALVLGVDLLRFTMPALNLKVVGHLTWFTQEHESGRITSASWFWVAMSLIATVSEFNYFLATLVTLSVGDPAGSIVGRKIRSPNLIHGRTVAGTSAFIFASLIATMQLFLRQGESLSDPSLWGLLGLGSLLGAMIELFSAKFDDNLLIGIGVGLFYTTVGPLMLNP